MATAQTLAALNHSHIAAIFGLEDAAGVKALVMEVVEGEVRRDGGWGAVPHAEADDAHHLIRIQNWFEELKTLVQKKWRAAPAIAKQMPSPFPETGAPGCS